ncbi:outer membrane protein assembly factor BamB family protein [Natronorubrum sediminis]|nr:PQQ-binding-like beta-propeller repeat protein [Natronorubrum sediminis]
MDSPDGWSSLGGGQGNTGFLEDETGPEDPVAPAWQYNHSGMLAVVDDVVYLAGDDEVHALDAETGSREWEVDVEGVEGAPAVAYDTVYLGGEQLTALDAADGDVRWELDLEPDEVIASPNVEAELVLVVADGVVYAVDALEGEVGWEYEPADEQLHEQAVAIVEDICITASETQLYALDVHNGSELWTYESDDDSLDGQFASRLAAYPMATKEYVVAMRANDELSIHDLEDGEEEGRVSNFSNPEGAITDDRILNTTGMDSYYAAAHDLETGESEWEAEESGLGATPPITDGDLVYSGLTSEDEFSDGETGDRFYAFDIEDGSTAWQIDTGASLWPLAVVGETLYVGTLSNDGMIFALRSNSETDADEDDIDEEPEDDGDSPEEEVEGDSEDTDESDDDDDEAPDGDADADGGSDDDGDDADADGDSDTDSDDDADDGSDDADDDADDDDADDADDDGADEDEDDDDADDADDAADDDTEDAADDDADDAADADGDDSVPGFTTGAGLLGGALSLEWLRRREMEPDEEEEA